MNNGQPVNETDINVLADQIVPSGNAVWSVNFIAPTVPDPWVQVLAATGSQFAVAQLALT